MKRNIFLVLLMIAACVQPAWSQGIKVWRNGQFVFYHISEVDSLQFVANDNAVGHEYVDLGLPSGTLWATCNVGANSPEDYGDYFAWGETDPKNEFDWETYKFTGSAIYEYVPTIDDMVFQYPLMTKYCTNSEFSENGFTDGLTELLPEDDAATANWGDDWQMPSKEQMEELLNSSYTTSQWVYKDDKYHGYEIKSKSNGNSIFLPAAGFYNDITLNNEESSGQYWSRSLDVDYYSFQAYLIDFDFRQSRWQSDARWYGRSVRPVRKQGGGTAKLVTRIDLSETQLTCQPDDQYAIYATVIPADAANTNLTWESSDESVAVTRPIDGTTPGYDTSSELISNSVIVVAVSPGTCTIICRATDGSGVYAECQVTVQGGDVSDHEYVDLGLPSGTLWATCNIGANSPEDYGDYFAWGETSPKGSLYSWDNYAWMIVGGANWNEISKYTFADNQTSGCWYLDETFIGDGMRELLPEDDAAAVNWGGNWCMPSIEQYVELINSEYTTATWTTLNGVKGKKITSNKNGNSIFLPAAGYWDGSLLYDEGTTGRYWSRFLTDRFTDWADFLYFSQNELDAYYGGGRYYGKPIRPVQKP